MDTELLEFRIEEQLTSTSKDLVPLSLSGKNQSTLHYGKFYLSGLKKGQGITVANALRRVLLYDIFGIGITKVKFTLNPPNGAPVSLGGILRSGGKDQESTDLGESRESLRSTIGRRVPVSNPEPIHEFSTVSGMKESILELLINLRTIIWKKPSRLILSDNRQLDMNFVNIHGKCILKELTKLPLLSNTENDSNVHNTNLKSDSILPGVSPSEEGPKEGPKERAKLSPPFFVLRAKHLVKGLTPSVAGYPPRKTFVQNLDDSLSLVGANETSQTNKSFSGEGGSGALLSADFLPQIVNPEQYLATFLPVDNFESSEGGFQRDRRSPAGSPPSFPKLEIDFQVQEGTLTAEKQTEGVETEFLVDAGPFFPIKKVNYTVETQKNSTKNMLSDGEAYECVFFEIWTDGSIHPQTALSEGFSILETFFKQK